MEETSQKYKKAHYYSAKDGVIGQGGSKMPKRHGFLFSVSVLPFFLAPSFFGLVDYVSSLVSPAVSYAEEAQANEGPKMISLGYRRITAYNPVHGQTQGDPCEPAWPVINVCETKLKIIATERKITLDTGEVIKIPLDAKVRVEGFDDVYIAADTIGSDHRGERWDVLVNPHNTPGVTTMKEAIKTANEIGTKFGDGEHEVFLILEE